MTSYKKLEWWERCKYWAEDNPYVELIAAEGRRRTISEVMDKIQHMRLESKGTVEGTRNEILSELTKMLS